MPTPTVVLGSRPACLVRGAIGGWSDWLSQEQNNGRAGIHHHRCPGGDAVILSTFALRGVEVLPKAGFWPLLLFELGSLSILFWSRMLAGRAVNDTREGNDKIVWVIIILFTQVFGAGLYLFVRRPRRLAEAGRRPK